MRLCNALIQNLLLISVSLFIYNCYGHEHHNHVDPVTTQFSESGVTVDPLTKSIETANVQKNDFQQHNDDEHLHDTIEARLRAKHNLRQSVDQQTDDDKQKSEQDYINRLNSALENEYKTEHQFQYAVPPTEDTANNTPSQNQTKDDIQVPSQIQNETTPVPTTSIQTPTDQKTSDGLSSTEAPSINDTSKLVQNLDEKSDSKVVLGESAPQIQVQTNEQQPRETIQQNIIKEDILFIHKETIPVTQSHQQEDTLHVVKSTTDPNPPSSDQQQTIPNTILNNTLQDNSSLDVKPPIPTPIEKDPSQQPIPNSILNNTLQDNSSLDVKSSTPTLVEKDPSQQPTSNSILNNTLQDNSSLDVKPPIPTPIEKDPSQQPISNSTENVNSVDLKSDQQPTSETTQNISSSDQTLSPPTPIKTDQEQNISNSTQNVNSSDQQQPIPETIQNTSSIDHNTSSVQENQQPQVVDTVKSTATTSTNIKSDDISSTSKETPTLVQKSSPPTRVLRSATSRIQQQAQTRDRHMRSKQQKPQNITTTENATIEKSIEEHNHSIESSSSLKPEEPHVETAQQPTINLDIPNETLTEINDQNIKPIDPTDLPRQVHVHDPNAILNELKEDLNKNENPSLDQEIENNATVDSFLINDHSPHLPRILENEETTLTIDSTIQTITNTIQTIENHTETNLNLTPNDSKTEETNNSLPSKSNISDKTLLNNYRQVCWRLPKPFESSLELIENQLLRCINLLPDFLQTTLFGHVDDRETLMNTIWFGSICTMSFLFSFIFLSLGAKRLKQTKHEKEIRARCQQLQQYNNQIELERATFERQNQKLSDEIDELKNLPVRDADEEIFELREKYEHLHADWKIARTEHDALQRDIDYKQSLMQKHEFDMQKQVEIVAYLNDEILRQKQQLEKERETKARLQSNDLSLERVEQLQEITHELRSEITQLKQDKFAQTDQLQQVQEHANQLDIDNNELTIKMKQLKDLLEQRDETIARIREKMLNDNDDDQEKTTKIDDILSTATENNPDNNQQLLSTIDNDVEKANQHMRDLHSEIEEKTRRIKDLDSLLNQEKDHCRELETKLKVVLELRERDAHIHIRQLGQTDAELRKARTDTERVRILQQQLELKQQQLEDVQKVLGSEQMKFSEECSKLQHEIHEKWMEVKRLTRELDGSRKECEGLRRQITKYGHNDRLSLEKTMHKPVAQHMNNTSRVSSDPETNGSSPPLLPYQQGENFRPIDYERNDSGAASPAEMLRIRPPMFGLARPPFFPPPFMPPPPHNPFLLGPRFPMPIGGPHGMLSPIPHLMTNGSGGGSDTNSFEIVDSVNITPNSTSYDAQINGSAVSPAPDDEQQATAKTKKPKKSLKKKTKTSATTTVSGTKEDV